MENLNNNTNNQNPMPSMKDVWASWSAILGVLGIGANLFCMIYSLPAGIFFGIAGLAAVAMSKKGEPLSKQAVVGMILSIVAIGIGVLMFAMTVYALNTMKSNTPEGLWLRSFVTSWLEQLKGLPGM